MDNEHGIYRLLQQHLDKQAVGFPAAALGSDIRLLKRLFTPDEAKVALHLSYKPAPVEQIIATAAPEFSAVQTGRLLESMLMKGSIGWKEKNKIGHWFVLPLVIGMYEAQDGDPTPEFLADANAYMRSPAFGRAFMHAKPSQMRTIPIKKSITTDHHVATYDQIRDLVQNSPGPFVVLKCICRQSRVLKGKQCEKTTRQETCFAFNDMAAMVLRRRHGREVSREEALAIFQQNEDDGLVLQPANAQQPEFVCSCCGCCCGLLSYQKFLSNPVDFWTNHYQAEVDPDACLGCGTCVSRCQVNAATLAGPGGKATIDGKRCIGCGLCVPTCPSNAVGLKQKLLEMPVPKDEEALYDEIMQNKKSVLSQWRAFLKEAPKIGKLLARRR